jgi:hypothetical protein
MNEEDKENIENGKEDKLKRNHTDKKERNNNTHNIKMAN